MKKSSVFSNLLPVFVIMIFISSVYSCSETSKADSVKGKSLKVNNKKSNKPSCCASGIPARFPAKSTVER
ncbi:hypothetical protein SAMN05421813_11093 [Daejeonella rubra]|uniref:Uncharacterized protein n=1 Tax=Daejeonella rubra TaxID=990371 RepID=A0A1G9SJT7_9SPHI|nr:hypothetical protein SAMN05421813_11093 [Daejeonella rubra]